MNSILKDSGIEFDSSIKFGQQEKGQYSIPDVFIQQDSFKILIETKLYNQQDIKKIMQQWIRKISLAIIK